MYLYYTLHIFILYICSHYIFSMQYDIHYVLYSILYMCVCMLSHI